MTARSQLAPATVISQRLDAVTIILAGLQNNTMLPAGLFFRSPDNAAQMSLEVPVPVNAVMNLLTNLQTSLQNQLTALGVS